MPRGDASTQETRLEPRYLPAGGVCRRSSWIYPRKSLGARGANSLAAGCPFADVIRGKESARGEVTRYLDTDAVPFDPSRDRSCLIKEFDGAKNILSEAGMGSLSGENVERWNGVSLRSVLA
jgi:hypothetical protein